MNRAIVMLALVLAGCTTYKVWTDHEADSQNGVVRLSYTYGPMESPRADDRQGLDVARRHCQDWGYPTAQRKGEDRSCVEGSENDCKTWQVTREYRCVKEFVR